MMTLLSMGGKANAQNQNGLIVRSLSISTGYASIQLPPITLGGYLPQDALSADMITNGGADVSWARGRPLSMYAADLTGFYTQRAKYSKISSGGGAGSFSASHALFRRWEVSLSGSKFIANSDQLSFLGSSTGNLIAGANVVDALALARSVRPKDNPDIAQASLFGPIRESLAANEAYGFELTGQGASGSVSYARSGRFSAFGSFGYSNVRELRSSGEPGVVSGFPNSTAQLASVGITKSLTRRSYMTGAVMRNQSTGVFIDSTTSALVGYGWTGRKLFVSTTWGVGLTPVKTPKLAEGLQIAAAARSQVPAVQYLVAIGYKTRTQVFLGKMNRNINNATGYGALWGKQLNGGAGWYWTPLRTKWTVGVSYDGTRGLGNFTYINSTLVSAILRRSLGTHSHLEGSFFYDRHGSKGYEGFHLTREGFHVIYTWSPGKRLL